MATTELVSLVAAMAAAPIALAVSAMDLVEARIDPPSAPRPARVGAPVAHPAIAATVFQARACAGVFGLSQCPAEPWVWP